MAEGWVDCPALGPGWKRREAFRKSGATCGRTDTYYQSPTGEKFRSKIELSRFLGPERDLGNFDFKNGLERPGGGKARKGPKWRQLAGPPPAPPQLEEGGGPEEAELQEAEPDVAPPPPPPPPPPPTPPLAPPPPAEAPPPPEPPPEPPLARRTRKRPPPEPPQDTVVACCAGCQSQFPGVTLPPQRRCRWLCPECRARRRDFNREQRFFKRVGCGSCQACRIPEDCGICSACARRPHAPARAPKCLLRRCLRIVKKGLGCGACQGCVATEDCGSCCICLRRLQPGLKRQWRCLRRRCLRPKSSVAAKKPPCGPRALAAKWKPPGDREPSAAPSSRHRKQLTQGKEKKKPGRPPKHPGARGGARGAGRGSRRCGACAACLRAADCGRCDFCRDKPRFGGRNRWRQKCRWRQCLRRAMDKELPGGAEESPGPPPGPPALLLAPPAPHPKEEPAPALRPRPEDPRGALSSLGLLIASAPRLKQEQPQASSEPPLAPDPRAGLSDLGLLIASAPRLKQEQPQPSASLVPMPPRLPPAELVVLDESEEEEEEAPSPVPLPLPPPSPPPRWPGAFLAELAEIPLPAHWGLMGRPPPPSPPSPPPPHPPHPLPLFPPPSGLRLVQRCPRSPMAAAVVLLGPGLAFRVLVARRRPVPPGHEVLARRPPRLRGVDDLVELLCDLEAYGACPGPPGRAPGPRCHVLAPAGRCCPPCLLEGGQA